MRTGLRTSACRYHVFTWGSGPLLDTSCVVNHGILARTRRGRHCHLHFTDAQREATEGWDELGRASTCPQPAPPHPRPPGDTASERLEVASALSICRLDCVGRVLSAPGCWKLEVIRCGSGLKGISDVVVAGKTHLQNDSKTMKKDNLNSQANKPKEKRRNCRPAEVPLVSESRMAGPLHLGSWGRTGQGQGACTGFSIRMDG